MCKSILAPHQVKRMEWINSLSVPQTSTSRRIKWNSMSEVVRTSVVVIISSIEHLVPPDNHTKRPRGKTQLYQTAT